MKKFLAVIAICLFPAVVGAQEKLSKDQVEDLKAVKGGLEMFDRMEANGKFNKESNAHYHQEWLQIASNIAGQPVLTVESLDEVIAKNDNTKYEGFFTFINIVWVFAGIILAIAIGSLCVIYLGPLVIAMPVGFWEFAAYVFTIVGMMSGAFWPGLGIWFVIPSCLLLIGALSLTKFLHFGNDQKDGQGITPGWYLNFTFTQFVSLTCTLAWGTAAIYYQSYLLGFMTVMMLQAFLGFSVIVMPGCVAMGFDDDDNIPRATVASFVILVVYAITELTGGFKPMLVDGHEVYTPLIYFRTGAMFMGAFVYFLGLLICSSYYYTKKQGNYFLMQLITIASGVAAFFFGATFGLNMLLGIGGTFFVLYLLEKYTELPWKHIGWAWGLLGLAAMLYGAAHLAQQYPQYFLLGLK